MWTGHQIAGYIDPNTSQQVFSLLGPVLTLLATVGGVMVTSLVVVRHRVVSYFRKASWPRRIATVGIALGVCLIVSLLVGRFIW